MFLRGIGYSRCPETINMTRSTSNICLLSVVCMFMFGCATGPTYSSMQSQIPTVESGKGRVFFYRSSSIAASFIQPGLGGSAIQPDISIDGQRVGSAVPGKVFFVDLTPGTHSVFCQNQTVTIHLGAGESRYVSFEVFTDAGVWNLRPILIHPD